MGDWNSSNAWERYYDESYGAYYWYNSATGESQWEEQSYSNDATDFAQHEVNTIIHEENAEAYSQSTFDSRNVERKTVQRKNKAIKSEKKSKRGTGQPALLGKDFSRNSDESNGRTGDKYHGDHHKFDADDSIGNSHIEVDDADSDAETEDTRIFIHDNSLLIPGGSDTTNQIEMVHAAEEIRYRRMLYCNGIFFEAPFCVVEGAARSALLLFLLLIRLIWIIVLAVTQSFLTANSSETISQQLLHYTKTYLREICFTLAGSISLVVPGVICCVYWHYHSDGDWNLAAIPTIIGSVDPRRFASITVFGNGSSASNANSYLGVKQSMNTSSTHIDQQYISLDSFSWSKDDMTRTRNREEMMFVPREVLRDLKSFLAGRNSIESFNLQL